MSECIVCHHLDVKPKYSGLVQCNNCRHIFSDVNVDDKEIFDLYKNSYFFGEEYKDYLADKTVIQKNFKLRLKTLEKFLDPQRHQNLLEIGCAFGFFLEMVRSRFNTVLGIDISDEGIAYSKKELGLNAVRDDFLKHDFHHDKFDVICLWDTIEHLKSPQLYLEKASRLMDKGGLIAITTGDIGSLNARMKKDKWRLIHPPTHIHYFSKKTLGKILDHYGFDVIYNRPCGFYRSVDLAAHRLLVLNNLAPKLYDFFKKIRLTQVVFYLNLYDIRYVIARKR